MKEKMYVKDILDRFQITRDALKYYEKQGIVQGYRDDNGYRYYDYLAVKRIERVLWLLKMGFSIEKIKQYLDGLSFEQEIHLNKARMQELEDQIVQLQEKLRFVKHMDAHQQKIMDYYRHYSICHDVKICTGCEQGKNTSIGSLGQREMRVLQLNQDCTIVGERLFERSIAKEVLLYSDPCKNCSKASIVHGPFVQGIIKLENFGGIERIFPRIRLDMEQQGYEMGTEVYCYYGYYIEAEPKEEGIAVNFFIPLRKKEETDEVL